MKCVRTDLYMKLHTELGCYGICWLCAFSVVSVCLVRVIRHSRTVRAIFLVCKCIRQYRAFVNPSREISYICLTIIQVRTTVISAVDDSFRSLHGTSSTELSPFAARLVSLNRLLLAVFFSNMFSSFLILPSSS